MTSGCGGRGFYHPFSEQDMQLSGCSSHANAGTQLSGFYPFQSGPVSQFPDMRLPGAMVAGAPSWVHMRYPPKPTKPPAANRGLHAAGFAVLTALGRL